MKNHLSEYKTQLEKTIGEYMERPVSERSADAVDGMTECWIHIAEAEKLLEDKPFTCDDAKHWAEYMINDDGTTGAHWTMEQTTGVAKSSNVKFEHVTEWAWWITLNYMYSDYCMVGQKFGTDTAEFYAELAKAFLFDKDAPKPMEKLGAYYHCIVCKK